MRALHTRNVSTDNTINIVFGLASVLIGIVTVMFGWLMWKLKKRRQGKSPHVASYLCMANILRTIASTKTKDEDDSELLPIDICDVRRIVHNGDGFEVTLRLGRRRSRREDEFH